MSVGVHIAPTYIKLFCVHFILFYKFNPLLLCKHSKFARVLLNYVLARIYKILSLNNTTQN